jgi:nickel-dependent lactate racemase
MTSVLKYGNGATLRLELADETRLTRCDAPRGHSLDDLGAAVRCALAEPLELPPLERAVVPGDKVVLAIAEPVPQIALIVAETVDVLLAAGIEVADVTIVRTIEDRGLGAAEFTEAGAVICVHEPSDRESLSYLAASAEGKPIYINRAIHDADLVVSIGRIWPAGSLGDHGMHAGLLAAFSDTANRDRYRSPKPSLPAQRDRLRSDAEEAGWLLGMGYSIRVVPGAAGGVICVLAGEVAAVDRRGQEAYTAAWRCPIPQRAELVIATIEGGASEQTWENLARALESAAAVASGEAAIAVCSELAVAPGAGLQQLIGAESLTAALRDIVHHKPPDALAAGAVARALERGTVYLVSRLDDELVEDLGMRPLASDQVSRLALHYGSVLVLANAPYAVAALHSESDLAKKHSPKARK